MDVLPGILGLPQYASPAPGVEAAPTPGRPRAVVEDLLYGFSGVDGSHVRARAVEVEGRPHVAFALGAPAEATASVLARRLLPMWCGSRPASSHSGCGTAPTPHLVIPHVVRLPPHILSFWMWCGSHPTSRHSACGTGPNLHPVIQHVVRVSPNILSFCMRSGATVLRAAPDYHT